MHSTNSTHPARNAQHSGASGASRSGWWQVALAVLVALCVLPVQAQYRASLQGTVADSSGAMIPGAQLTLQDKETNRAITSTSDASGTFSFNQLPPSAYSLTVTRDGFKKKFLDNVRIIAEQANALNVVLEVGGTAETVTVNASATPLIDTATGSVSGTISQNDLAKMPDFGRDPLQLVRLAPGVFGDAAQNGGGGASSIPGNQGSGGTGSNSGPYITENRAQISANGGRSDTNAVTLDGVAITSVTWGASAVVTPNPDSIKEMKVVSNGYDAEYGRFGGAQIQMITQNGTNQIHGTALYKMDRPGLNAYQRYNPSGAPVRSSARYNEFGGTVGGPVIHNKLFGFFSYDTIRNNGTTYGSGWYETSSFDNASTSGTTASKFLTLKGNSPVYTKILEGASDGYDCARVNLVQGVNCNFIQGQGLDIGKALTIGTGKQDPSYANPSGSVYTPGLGGDGTGSISNLDGNADIMYLQTQGPNNNINTQYSGRADWQVTNKDLIAGTFYYVPVNNTTYNGANRDSNIFYHHAKNYSAGLLFNHTFSPTLLNEARADMAGWKYNELSDNPQSPLGLPDVKLEQNNGGGLSFMSAYMINSTSSSTVFGPSVGGVFDQWTLNFKDVLTKVQGAHNLKFGGQFTKLAYLDEPTWDGVPTYYFNNLWDFMNDAPNGEVVIADPTTGKPSYFRKDDRQNLLAFFAQDDWKIRPNLTVNLGLRWEYFGGMYEKSGNEPNVRLGSGSNVLTDLHIQVGGNQVNAPKWNFGPQVGFAWIPMQANGKLVVRGGFGINYNGLEQAITTNTRNNPPFAANQEVLTGSKIVYGTADNLYAAGGLPANPNLVTTFNSANLPANGSPTGITGLPTDFPTAYIYHYSLQAQYDLGQQWVATVGYNASMGRHLPLQTNLNNFLASKILTGQVAFNPIVSGIDWYYDGGKSSFNALELELRHDFSHGFTADAQYRWAKSLDDGSGPYTTADYEWLQGYNYGVSDFDVRQSLKLFANWSPVIFHGEHSWLEKVAGGWNISPIFTLHTGFPFNPTYPSLGNNAFYAGSNNYGGQSSMRPTSYAGGAGSSQSTDTFKKSNGNFTGGGTGYFTTPNVPQGNAWTTDVAPTPVALPDVPGVSRNAFFGPRYSDVDLAMTKAFGLPTMKVLGEGARLEIRANAFNLFNKLNLSSPDATITDSTFGRANTALGSRTIEVEAHFKF